MDQTVALQKHRMPPRLLCLYQGQVTEFALGGQQRLGRITESSRPELGLTSPVVSRSHGSFFVSEHGAFYQDNGSTNGTLRNGQPLPPRSPAALQSGDVLRIHGAEDAACRWDVILVYQDSYPEGTLWQEQRLSRDIAEIAVGRAEALALHDQSVSRRHASFFLAREGWAVIDHDSLNGVRVGGVRIARPVYLHAPEAVGISEYLFFFTGDRLIYQADTRPAQAAGTAGLLSISIVERNVWHRMKKKTLLRDINLEIPTGSMVLVLGGSGAGKTTFMNAVMGYERAEGQIRYNSTDIYAEYDKMKYEIGYVPQQDLLRMNDTVQSTLENAARMRMPAGLDETAYRSAVDRTCALLGLDRERGSLVGKLSGGQRKRLSIGVEYIGNPSLFFLDEPDSGLDGTMARALMENLRSIADQGKIVLVISHSPDRAFALFDRVIVLAKGSDDCGHMVFYGSPKEACAFFEVEDLEHIVKRINRPDEGGDGLADLFIEKYARGGNRYE